MIATLSAPQIEDLSAFIGALTDQGFVTNPAFANPDTACGKRL